MLRALGAPVERPEDVPDAAQARRLELWRRRLEPVAVAWDGRLHDLRIRLPAKLAEEPLQCSVVLEGHQDLRWVARTGDLPPAQEFPRSAQLGGDLYVERTVPVPFDLPVGYHTLNVDPGDEGAATRVISAPSRAPALDRPGWGVFLPLYALHSRRSWGIGDITDLGAMAEWVAGLGGTVAATLPILASFIDEPFDPSPYSPVSRLFWNEIYVDVAAVPEPARSPEARRLLASPWIRREVEALSRSPLVDHRRVAAAKRRGLESMARSFFQGPADRVESFHAYLREHPAVHDYARFRAACERYRRPWQRWPGAEREGRLPPRRDPDAVQYHVYVQWLAEEQLRGTAKGARSSGAVLYFDLPLGVNPAGYDVWRERDSFAPDVSVGSPPDAFFAGGQNWGFPPLDPNRIRDRGHAYSIASLRTVLRHAGVLRLDHVMALHRLFWIPHGMDAQQGVYVGYRPEEQYAILALEAHRAGAAIVGEDLGTVPESVRRTMARRGLYRSYVMQYELTGDPGAAVRKPPRGAVAGLNTHDMPTFASFWRGKDLELRAALGWLDRSEMEREQEERERLTSALARYLRDQGWLYGKARKGRAFEAAVLRACLRYLAAGPSRLVTVNLEDLWLEPHPQNMPGTTDERANWRRRGRYGLEAFRGRPQVVGTLLEMNALRKRAEGYGGARRRVAPSGEAGR